MVGVPHCSPLPSLPTRNATHSSVLHRVVSKHETLAIIATPVDIIATPVQWNPFCPRRAETTSQLFRGGIRKSFLEKYGGKLGHVSAEAIKN